MTSSDRFPVPIGSAVKLIKYKIYLFVAAKTYVTCFKCINMQASTTELGKLFQIFTIHAEKKMLP